MRQQLPISGVGGGGRRVTYCAGAGAGAFAGGGTIGLNTSIANNIFTKNNNNNNNNTTNNNNNK